MSNLFRDNLYNEFPDPNKKIEELEEDVETAQDSIRILQNSINSKEVNLKYPQPPLVGVRADGTDETSAIQGIFNFAKANKLNVYAPAGNYGAKKIIIKTGVSISGAGEKLTKFTPVQSTEKGFFIIEDPEPVANVVYSGFTIAGLGTTNPKQNGFHLEAVEQTIPSYTGGFWWSRMADITIQNFDGCQIYLRAQDGRGDMANQFLTFTNVKLFRTSSVGSRCLKAIGQLGQTKWVNCEFDYPSASGYQSQVGTINVEISREFQSDGVTPLNDVSPSVMSFDTCTFQNSDLGVKVDRSSNVQIVNGWFENLNRGVRFENSSFGCTVEKCRFSNAGSDGSNTGYGVMVGTSSSAMIVGNYFIGSTDFAVKGSSHRGIFLQNNYQDGGLKTIGVTRQLAVNADGSVNAYYSRELLVNTSDVQLKTITGYLGSGDELIIRAFGTSPATLTIIKGGNIVLPTAKTQLTLAQHEAAVFYFSDLAGGWVLKSPGSGTLT